MQDPAAAEPDGADRRRVSNSSDIIQSINVEYMAGELMRLWQSRMLIIPLPLVSVENQSRMLSAGSPKNRSPPASSRATTARMIALMLCFARFPYSAENSYEFS